jgi:hypothetical protein
MLTRILDEDGATAIIIAAAMVLFLGMAALAVDYGLGVNERRADQTAVDVGSTAGAGAALNGIYGTNGVRTEALRYVRANLPTTYSDAEWRSIWESCVDPAAERNAGGHQFVALTPPAGWVATDPTNWCLSFETSSGLFRVRVPQQVIDAAFGPIVGVDELSTRAIAVSRIGLKGKSGILPFGLPGGANGVVCLSSGPSGISFDPCDGASAGNFGTIKAVKTGRQQLTPDDPVATTEDCSPNPNTVLAQNILTTRSQTRSEISAQRRGQAWRSPHPGSTLSIPTPGFLKRPRPAW